LVPCGALLANVVDSSSDFNGAVESRQRLGGSSSTMAIRGRSAT